MWQDGLALLIVAGAVFGLVRAYIRAINGDRRQRSAQSGGDDAAPLPGAMTANCHGCDLAGCFQARIAAKKPGIPAH